jgi:hypothetical protein
MAKNYNLKNVEKLKLFLAKIEKNDTKPSNTNNKLVRGKS